MKNSIGQMLFGCALLAAVAYFDASFRWELLIVGAVVAASGAWRVTFKLLYRWDLTQRERDRNSNDEND